MQKITSADEERVPKSLCLCVFSAFYRLLVVCEWFLFVLHVFFSSSFIALAPFHRAACTVSAISFVSFLATITLSWSAKNSIQFFHLQTKIIKNNLHLLFFAFVCSLLLFSTFCVHFFFKLSVCLFICWFFFFVCFCLCYCCWCSCNASFLFVVWFCVQERKRRRRNVTKSAAVSTQVNALKCVFRSRALVTRCANIVKSIYKQKKRQWILFILHPVRAAAYCCWAVHRIQLHFTCQKFDSMHFVLAPFVSFHFQWNATM